MKVITGAPGTSWTNDTAKTLWQLHVAFFNSCGRCIQFAGQVAAWWNVPFHRGCHCVNVPVPPGATAAPFVDFLEELGALPDHQKAVAVGAANWRLIEAKAARWSDVVTAARVKPLHEVVAELGLTVGQMEAAGVPKGLAKKAHDLAFHPAAVAAEAEAKALTVALKDKGLGKARVKASLKAHLKANIGLDGGPGTGPSALPTPKPPAPPSIPKPKGPFGHFFKKGEYPRTPAGLAQAKADWGAKLSKGLKASHAAKAASKAEAKALARAAAKTPAPPADASPFPADVAGLRSIRSLGGHSGTDATLVEDAAGRRFVMKSGGRDRAAQLREEHTAEAAYRALGVPMPASRLYETAAGPVKLAEFVEGRTLGALLRADPASAGRAMAQVRKHFAADALLSSWDVVGADFDNILVTADGRALRIDVGGALRYRAQGAAKGGAFGGTVGELYSLRDAGKNPQAAKVFGPLSDAGVRGQVQDLLQNEAALRAALPADQALRTTLDARLRDLERWASSRPAPEPAAGVRSFTKLGAPVTEADRKDAADWAKAHWGPWTSEVSGVEREAIRHYKGSGYQETNGALRGAAGRELTPRIEAQAAAMDAALNKAHVPQDIIAWRGVRNRHDSQFHDPQDRVGSVVQDRGFVSVSTNKKVSEDGFYSRTHGAMLRIRVPAGTPAGYVDGLFGTWQGEFEILLHRESSFKITGVGRYDDGGMLIDVDLVHSPHARPKP